MNKLIIVGIDPGTTTAYAVLDLYGNLIKLESSKLLNFSSLITEVMKYGNVVAVAADTNPASNFVDKFAKKFGARLIFPKDNLMIVEKRRLISGFKTNNVHERDALSAAIFAFKETRRLIEKIDNSLRKSGKEEFLDEVKKVLLTKKGFSISKVLELLERKEKKRDTKETKIEFKKREVSNIEKENLLLTEQNKKLKREIGKLIESNKYLLRKAEQTNQDEKSKETIGLKDRRIESLSHEISNYKKLIEDLKEKNNSLKKLLLNLKDNVLVKRAKNLGKDILNVNFKEENILFVDDPNIISENAINLLEGNVNIIISNMKANDKLKNKFVFIDGRNMIVKENEDFVLVNREKLENEKNKKEVLYNIIKEYKEKRG